MDEKGAEMQEEMDETLAGLADKLAKMEQHVSGTVRTVKESVDNVRESFDLRLHVRRRPWTLLASASALGFFGGYRSGRDGSLRPAPDTRNLTELPPHADAAFHAHTKENGSRNGNRSERAPADPSPGWLAGVGVKFEPELAELRGLVFGTLLGLAREVIINQARRPPKEPERAAPDVRRSRTVE